MSTRDSSTYTDSTQEHDLSPQTPRDEENTPASEGEQQHESKDPSLVEWDEDDREYPRN